MQCVCNFMRARLSNGRSRTGNGCGTLPADCAVNVARMEAMTARRYKSTHERIGRFKVWRTGAHVPKADARVFTSEGSSLPLTVRARHLACHTRCA